MKIYFVRHGYPDYDKDCLTELGHLQAEAVAHRLENVGIEQVFSSIQGRAVETAKHTADLLGLDVIKREFIRELGWGPINNDPDGVNGHPWHAADNRVLEGKSLLADDWREDLPYCKSNVVKSVERVSTGIDLWLEELGYKREGEFYRVIGENTNKTIAMFSHGGASSAALSHMLNIPFPQYCGTFLIDFTSITVIHLSDNIGELACPKIALFNDAKHIEGLTEEKAKLVYGPGTL